MVNATNQGKPPLTSWLSYRVFSMVNAPSRGRMLSMGFTQSATLKGRLMGASIVPVDKSLAKIFRHL